MPFVFSISVLPASAFENLNSLETLNIQNNKLTRIPEEVMEPIIDTLRVVDIVGMYKSALRTDIHIWQKKNTPWTKCMRVRFFFSISHIYLTPNQFLFLTFVLTFWYNLLFGCSFLDNPLICSCELIWFPELLQSLKDRDDEMTQKKRPMCLMEKEHREYFVQSMPLGRMNCVGKRTMVNSKLNSGAATTDQMLLFSLISIISLYFWAD